MTPLEALNAQITIKIRELDALRAEREALSPSPPVDLHPYAELSAENETLRALLTEVAASMQVSPLRMELRGRIRAALAGKKGKR